MNADDLKARISNLNIWKKNGERAPHKPLLILYALGQFYNGKKLSILRGDTHRVDAASEGVGPGSEIIPPGGAVRPSAAGWNLGDRSGGRYAVAE